MSTGTTSIASVKVKWIRITREDHENGHNDTVFFQANDGGTKHFGYLAVDFRNIDDYNSTLNLIKSLFYASAVNLTVDPTEPEREYRYTIHYRDITMPRSSEVPITCPVFGENTPVHKRVILVT
jgi:hypothetical protein